MRILVVTNMSELFSEAALSRESVATHDPRRGPPSEVPRWLSTADCVVFISAHEGSPVVTKETLCCGSCIASVDVGDFRAQVKGFSGCRCVEADAEKIEAGVCETLAEDASDAARARALFDTAREADALTSLYASLVSRG